MGTIGECTIKVVRFDNFLKVVKSARAQEQKKEKSQSSINQL